MMTAKPMKTNYITTLAYRTKPAPRGDRDQTGSYARGRSSLVIALRLPLGEENDDLPKWRAWPGDPGYGRR